MKILHLSCIAPPDIGGIGASASEMVKHLCERGVGATLVAPVRRAKDGEEDAPWITRLPAPLRWGNGAVLSGVKALIRSHDIVHVHYPFFGTAEAAAQDCMLFKKPLVITFHMDAVASGLLGVAFQGYRFIAQPALLGVSRRVFVSSHDYAEHSSLRGFMRAHPERVMELPFGVDGRFTPGDQAAARTTLGLPLEKRLIGFVGGMDRAHAFKGVPVLLQALQQIPDAHLLLVGDGSERGHFKAQAKDLGIVDRCHFLDRLAPDVLIEAYRCMDVLAFPSTSLAEAFGLVALEAMACGIPVVASDIPGVRSVVADAGILVPPKNASALATALRSVLSDAALRQRLSAAARERAARQFSWDRHVDGLIEAYRTLM
ncbi:MAG: hypothetical protein RL141_939 [Candidatus Parcubacteria bacterium]|jgi:glycosyltransferase involved in cell wall biosynthesis